MQKEEFWKKLDDAVSNPDHDKAMEEVVAALQQGYEENQELLCATLPDPLDRSASRQLFLPIGGYRYFILFTSFEHFFSFSKTPGLGRMIPGLTAMSVEGFDCVDELDDVVRRDVIGGIVFNPKFTANAFKGFEVSKQLLTFVTPKKPKPKIQHVHSKKRKRR